MGDYLAVFRSEPAHGGGNPLMPLRRRLEAGGHWSVAAQGDAFGVWTTGSEPPPVRVLADGGVLIGDLYAKRTGARLDSIPGLYDADASAQAAARALAQYAWGAYVAIWPAENGLPAIWRDPSGALEALVWCAQGLIFCASSLQAPLVMDLLPPLSVDWRRVGAFLCNPSDIGWEIALDGLSAVPPGVLRQGAAGTTVDTVIWTPAHAASQPWEEDRSAQSLATELEATLDRCVAALLRSRRVLCEISGGLDSACMASCAKRAAADVAEWINYVGEDVEGDEREFARSVALRLGVTLTEVAKPVIPLSGFDLVSRCASARPPLNAMDAGYDEDLAQRLLSSGSQAVLTGQGGDIVFSAMAASDVMDDAIRRCGWRARVSAFARTVARTNQSPCGP